MTKGSHARWWLMKMKFRLKARTIRLGLFTAGLKVGSLGDVLALDREKTTHL